MTELTNGMLVHHAMLGLGKIVALEPKTVHVFFADSKDRFATKLWLPVAGPLLRPAVADENAWLSGMSVFSRDAKTGRFALAHTWLSHEEAVERFLEAFPQGFADPTYAAGVKGRLGLAFLWRRAHETFVASFGGGEGERLLAEGQLDELVARARRIESLMRPVQKDMRRLSYTRSLEDPAIARGFFAALFALVAAPAPDQAAFEALVAVVAEMTRGGSAELGWAAMTELPFAAQPERHVPLEPKFTCDAAHRLGLNLSYDPTPNWSTYAVLLRSFGMLLDKLRPLGARDHVDVEAFLHVAISRRRALPLVDVRAT